MTTPSNSSVTPATIQHGHARYEVLILSEHGSFLEALVLSDGPHTGQRILILPQDVLTVERPQLLLFSE